ncbi:SRPBCC family protein [Saliterribacillus persicus]|uniref:Uncharacterized protein YndB with AHSA1/START domain n=1 Tax=Saliterribacillus persicus TaxID=930114 RepID=A0A368XZE5_9BACI|nr:SRPBCC domain-containing protein [Saliterribacillus persicus]RCW73235.1 uncharacterized protein YndB with AHSA1/START domain [Saliterribacillus persicus]
MSESNVQKHVIENNKLIVERTFNAPKQLLFQVFSESNHLENWWGPKGWKTKNHHFDFASTGVWHYGMECIDQEQSDWYGEISWGKAVYQEIVRNERIVYHDYFSDQNGDINQALPGMEIAAYFYDLGSQSKIVMENTFQSKEELKKLIEMGVLEGVSSQFEKLDEYLEEINQK